MEKVKTSKEDIVNLIKKNYTQFILRTFRYTNSMVLAEDILQDVMLELFKKGNFYRIDNNPNGYILKMIHNHSIDYLRKKKIQLLELDENLVNIAIGYENDNNEKDICEKLASLAEKAKLNDEQLEYFKLFCLGLTNETIALRKGVDSSIVRTKKQTIMRRLRKVSKMK